MMHDPQRSFRRGFSIDGTTLLLAAGGLLQ
jgi:hypothetical protein